MTPTTTTHKNSADQTSPEAQLETVLEHFSLKKEEKAQQECWVNFGVAFHHSKLRRVFLQPGQFLPIWSLYGEKWKYRTPVEICTVSAFVIDGRYMVRGGDRKLNSHPLIQDWEDGTPMRGAASALRFPGGVRKLTLGNIPMIAANAGNYEARDITARAFHDTFSQATLLEGCPIEIVCRTDSTSKELPLHVHVAKDMIRDTVITCYALPIPMIISHEEEVVLKDYPQNWTDALRSMLKYLGVTEIGIMYKLQNDDLVEDFSACRPQEIYRNVINKEDLGVSTLDYNLYERMLPFATGKFDAELISGV